ncbi:MAG TPA: fumarylacetoacetate hydrolase family protein [Terriglobia bacterium]|nr:fumarylacetoacetate hydrolase family protein [Terriglobia bacterium]
MKLFRTRTGIVVENAGSYSAASAPWDTVINSADLRHALSSLPPCSAPAPTELLAPIDGQEVWAAGVTYIRSRQARIEESEDAGGGDFYARVYQAARPELFFKSPGYRAVGPGAQVRIRRDARWSVPEPELTLVINNRAEIIGYTGGNDMSARDIEGENPLYLPQAKIYDGSCALGPCVYLSREPLPAGTTIEMSIERGDAVAFRGATTIANIKRPLPELVQYLYRETSFPKGCLLMTGTGVVPPNDFTLQAGDVINVTIEPIGCLSNRVA